MVYEHTMEFEDLHEGYNYKPVTLKEKDELMNMTPLPIKANSCTISLKNFYASTQLETPFEVVYVILRAEKEEYTKVQEMLKNPKHKAKPYPTQQKVTLSPKNQLSVKDVKLENALANP